MRSLIRAALVLVWCWPALAQVAPATWSRDVAPVLYRNCASCHHAGGAGPFSLMTYEDARRWAPQVVSVTKSRYMPPWLPAEGYGEFADSRRMSDAEVATIRRWVTAGMLKGDAAEAPKAPQYASTWTLGKPDLVLTVEEPYTLQAGGEDVFRNFILPYPLAETHYVRAMEILPGVASSVHHANVLVDRTASYRRAHAADWKAGVPGMELVVDAGKGFDPDGHFLFWKPDTPALVEPAGMPWRLDAGNDLILNMHLKPSGKEETIRAQIGLYFTDEPPKEQPMLLQLDRDDGLRIPAGDRDFRLDDELTLPVAVEVLGIYPHAHYLGKELKAWAILPDGRMKWLIWVKDWDIDRQSVYRYARPVRLPKGTTVHMSYQYDNSAGNVHNPHSPPVEVRAGNRSEDEMAHLWLQVLPEKTADGVDPRLLLEEAWMRSRLKKVPGDYVSEYNLGAALAGEGKAREAAEVFQRIVKEKPADGRSWNALGAATESAGDWQGARASYERAVGLDGGDCDARFNLAEVELKHDLLLEAEGGFRAELADCGEDVDAMTGLGVALLGEQRFAEAQVEFGRALGLKPAAAAEVDLREHLAFAEVQQGKVSEAIADLKEAVARTPGDAGAHALLAQILAQAGQLPEAIAEQKAALKLRAGDADGWNNLGVFEARSGDREAARRDFEEAEKVDPGNVEAVGNLVKLGVRR
jgi:Flp pilus assembly protein TadD/mono/diheme cytochrome c family protein